MWRAVPTGCRGGPDRQEAPPGREDTYRKHTIKQINNQKYPMPSSVRKLSKAIWDDVDRVTAFTCTVKEGCFLEMCVQSRIEVTGSQAKGKTTKVVPSRKECDVLQAHVVEHSRP